MVKGYLIVLIAIYCYCTSLTESKKYSAGNLPPLRLIQVNNIEQLLNGGPLNLSEAKLVEKSDKSEQNNENQKTTIDDLQQAVKPNFKDESELADSKAKNEDVDDNKVMLAVGSNFSDLAVLVPANLSALQNSNIHPHHIIGYVPLQTPNGQALVFPAGAVRLRNGINKLQQMRFKIGKLRSQIEAMEAKAAMDSDEDPEPEERGLRKRKRIRRRNSKSRLNRNRRRNNKNRINRKRRRNNKSRVRHKQNNRNKRRRKASNRRTSNIRRANRNG